MLNAFWHSRLNRKWFFLNLVLLSILFSTTKQQPPWDILKLSYTFLMFLYLVFIVRSRCNDIGLSSVAQVCIVLFSFIPTIHIVPQVYLLLKKGIASEHSQSSRNPLADFLYSRLNRKAFFANLMFICIIFSLIKEDTDAFYKIAGAIFIWILFILRSRCNDIGLSNWVQAAIIIASFIPGITVIPLLYLLLKKGMAADYTPCLKEPVTNSNNVQRNTAIEPITDVRNRSPIAIRKMCAVIFCSVTIAMCLFPPYHAGGGRFIGYRPIVAPPKVTGYVAIDYTRLIFQELILIVGCVEGYIHMQK